MEPSSDPPNLGLTQVPSSDPGLDVVASHDVAVLPSNSMLDSASVPNAGKTLDDVLSISVAFPSTSDGTKGNTVVSVPPVLNSRESLGELIGGADQNIFDVCTFTNEEYSGGVVNYDDEAFRLSEMQS